MKYRSTLISLTMAMLILASLSCSLPGGLLSGSSKYLGETYLSEEGGYSLKKIKDFSFEEEWGWLSMISPEGNETTGPAIFIIGGSSGDDVTVDSLMSEMTSNSSDEIQVENSWNYKVDGVLGKMAEIKLTADGQESKGRIFVAIPYGTQTFVFVGYALEEQWKDYERIVEAVLDTVTFFKLPEETSYTEETTEELSPEVPILPEEPSGNLGAMTTSGDFGLDTYSPQQQGGELRQWAISATASSEYMPESWSAMQATGPNTFYGCDDNSTSWASESSNTEEWLQLEYATPVHPTQLVIFETFNPSQVVEIMAYDQNDVPHFIYSSFPYVTSCPNVKVVNIDLDDNLTIKKIVIIVDQSQLGLGWAEIDAVELVGIP